MKLFGSAKKLMEKTKNGENVPISEVIKVVLVQRNIGQHQYQEKSEVLYTFMPNKSFEYLLNVELSNLVFDTVFDYITITLTDQHGRLLEIVGI